MDERGHAWGLVVRPLVILDLVIEMAVVIQPVADIDDKVIATVLGLQVFNDILNAVPV